ncbi:hypothetical protein A2V49_01035 [candidate division WWE3 bacterium RBG_19FT_COMBO_34_6]|uniref:Alpha-D-phosphohexomutase C-terminal domain-containing protein n=1 Tax=candidate division WWE3 bacterium RBG_19FT_COMBO_34_6 TaxID=1802612 RepID=A0A1F4UKY2_UNCKA|nr:MAG: hypothetical protein A2V49_01035 [candidate division WWE3 bacterium RBG_19FT_COMBO_34_6]
MDESNKPLSVLLSKYPNRVSTNEIKIECPDELKFKVINILKIYVMNFVDYKKIIDLDGIRVQVTDTGWFLIRASNTSSYLSLRAEGADSDELDKLIGIIKNALASIDIVKLKIDF